MKTLLEQVIPLAFSDETDTIWITMLVFVILVVGIGLWSLVKKKPDKVDIPGEDYSYHGPDNSRFHYKWEEQMQEKRESQTQKRHLPAHILSGLADDSEVAVADTSVSLEKKTAFREKVDLHSGMELLDLHFLLGVVSDIKHNGSTDIEMHKLGFTELMRRKQLNRIKSVVLKEYALNKKNYYDKSIQCEAIKELASRTKDAFDNNL